MKASGNDNFLQTGSLLQLLSQEGLLVDHFADCERIIPTYLSTSSKDVMRGTFFVCKGACFKKEYLLSAAENGAVIYMAEQRFEEADLPYIIVSDIRKALSLAARWFWDYPGDRLIKTGVTGTKGKTTITYALRNIINSYTDNHCCSLSTHEINIGTCRHESHLTTPEPPELQSCFAKAVNSGCTRVVMEVSSQAMKMQRVYGESYEAGIFTNIDDDHISPSEHSSMEEYLSCKTAFLKLCRHVVLNCETRFFDSVYDAVRDRHVIIYGRKKSIDDLRAARDGSFSENTEFAVISREELTERSSSFELTYAGVTDTFRSCLIGDYNVENLTAAILAAKLTGIPDSHIHAGILNVYVPGRLQLYHHGSSTFLVDYAHNHISLLRLFEMVRHTLKPQHITIVFGCAGERCTKRREDMGRLSDLYADKIILTMEDPGYEDCADICSEISRYITKPCRTILDRTDAIDTALDEAAAGELVIITGKGNETSQRIKGSYIECPSDSQLVEEWLKSHAVG